MTSSSRPDPHGRITVTTATFAEAGVETWSIVTKDREGQVVGKLIGENRRHQE